MVADVGERRKRASEVGAETSEPATKVCRVEVPNPLAVDTPIADATNPVEDGVHDGGISCTHCGEELTEETVLIGETAITLCTNCWHEGEEPGEFPAPNYNWSKEGGKQLPKVMRDRYPGVTLSQLTEHEIDNCILKIIGGPIADETDRDWYEFHGTPRNSPTPIA